jgi:hypothetical protein
VPKTQPPHPDDVPTEPDVSKLRCPSCRGRPVAGVTTCFLCSGNGYVNREVFSRWYAQRYGRTT